MFRGTLYLFRFSFKRCNNWQTLRLERRVTKHIILLYILCYILGYSELTPPPDPKSCIFLRGASQESRPNMRLVAVEQLRKIENDALEINIASFSLCLH